MVRLLLDSGKFDRAQIVHAAIATVGTGEVLAQRLSAATNRKDSALAMAEIVWGVFNRHHEAVPPDFPQHLQSLATAVKAISTWPN